MIPRGVQEDEGEDECKKWIIQGACMDIKILDRDDHHIRFLINGVETPVANALRRIMIAEVPSMIIDDVIILENSSPMKDEILAHRLGLLPLKTDLDSYVLRENCTCHSELGCSKCSVTLTLEAEATNSIRTVYSREMKSDNPEVVPASSDVPLLKLAEGQRIRLEAYAKLGRGIEHAKWQPVSGCAYKYAASVQIDPKKCTLCKKCVDACMKHVLKIENKKLIPSDPLKCNLCEECVEACAFGAIRVRPLGDSFIFNVESNGSLTPERIVLEANKILKEKAEAFIAQVSELKEGEEEKP